MQHGRNLKDLLSLPQSDFSETSRRPNLGVLRNHSDLKKANECSLLSYHLHVFTCYDSPYIYIYIYIYVYVYVYIYVIRSQDDRCIHTYLDLLTLKI